MSSQTVQCNICGKILKHKRYLSTHMFIHTGHSKYKCDQCGKIVSTQTTLKRHMGTHNDTKENINCPSCPQTFTHISNLYRHQRRYHQENSIINVNGTDVMHAQILKEQIQFQCEFCPKKFSQRHYLKLHQKSHKNQKSFNTLVQQEQVVLRNCQVEKQKLSNNNNIESNLNENLIYEEENIKVENDSRLESPEISAQNTNFECFNDQNSISSQTDIVSGNQSNYSQSAENSNEIKNSTNESTLKRNEKEKLNNYWNDEFLYWGLSEDNLDIDKIDDDELSQEKIEKTIQNSLNNNLQAQKPKTGQHI